MKYKHLLALFSLILILSVACRPETDSEESVGWLDGSPARVSRESATISESESLVLADEVAYEEVELVVEGAEAGAPLEKSSGDVPAAEPDSSARRALQF